MSTFPRPAPPREPHLLRFRLRQMLLFVALLSGLMALLVRTEGPWPLVIGGAALLVGAHVFGTMVGTRLRDTSQDVAKWRSATLGLDDAPRADLQPGAASRAALPPATPLADHGRVGRWLFWYLLGGAVLGLVVGVTLLGLTVGPHIGWAGWAVGTISCAVLGVWAAFLGSSMSSIARHAWRHAQEKGK